MQGTEGCQEYRRDRLLCPSIDKEHALETIIMDKGSITKNSWQ